jgi:DinB family protein
VDDLWKDVIWQQFGAAIDTLENALLACPEELWSDRSRRPELWYLVYHTLFFLDLYLSESVAGFVPPMPFTLDELDPAGRLPDRPYTKDELHTYLEHGRKKCHTRIQRLTEEEARRRCRFEWLDVSGAELLLYNLRHVQHHAAQLNLILRQTTDSAPGWVARAKGTLGGE